MEDNDKTFMPDFQPNAQECASLYEIYRQPGFQVLQRMFRSQVDMFAKAAMNLPLDAPDSVVAAHHRQAKAAVQFYSGVAEQIDVALNTYRFAVQPPMQPEDAVDDTEGVLDMDSIASTINELPVLF